MEIQYFKSAWGDIKNSPGWFGKLCLLALLNFIPIFGQIVTFAYLYGWAREIAWGVHEPLPRNIFANEDGKFWRRGWFVLVLAFVFAAVPQIVINLGDYWQGLGFIDTFFGGRVVDNPLLIGFGSLLSIVGWIAAVLCGVLAWIGAMRVAIYDRLSAGFQLGKIVKMLRHDVGGIVRIFGMELLFSFVLGILLSMVLVVLVAAVVATGVAGLVNAGYSIEALQYMTSAQALRMLVQFFASAGLVSVFAVLVGGFAVSLVVVFVDMLVIRAVGYWTMGFDVANWDGQDDPMPFELEDDPKENTWVGEPPRQSWEQPSQQAPSAPYGSEQRFGADGEASQPEETPDRSAIPVQPAGAVTSVAAFPSDVADADAPKGADFGDAASGSSDSEGLPTGALPGFTYAGTDEIGTSVTPDSVLEPLSEDPSDSGVAYDEALIVGAEFAMAPEDIEALRDERDGAAQDGAEDNI